jgi:putative endonuclease
MNSREIGNLAEEKVVKFLEQNKYKIVERNFYSRFGEIDIIAFKDDVYHFVEVKSGDTFEPIYNITPSKLQKIIKTMNLYLKKYKINKPYQIDAIIVKNDNIEMIENISMF